VAIGYILCLTSIARIDVVKPSMIQYSAKHLSTIVFIRIELAHPVLEVSGAFICLLRRFNLPAIDKELGKDLIEQH